MPTPEDQQSTEEKPAEAQPEQQSTATSTSSSTTASEAAPQEKPAEAQPADGAKPEGEKKVDDKPKSSLEAVMRVLEKSKPAETKVEAPKPEQPQASTVQDKKAAGEGEKDFIPEAEYRKLSPVVRQRISNLTTQRNEARDLVKSLEPRAKTSDDIVAYCTKNRVSPEDFQYGLHIMALVRTNPGEAWKQLQPLLQDLQAHVGEVLPADLADEVEKGLITEKRAKELAGARREAARLAETRKVEGEERTRADASRAYDESVSRNKAAVAAWEEAWKAKDPDYPKKAERVWERMVALINATVEQGKQITPEVSVEIAEKARKDVEDWLAQVLPRPREIKPGPGATGGGGSTASSTTVKQPASALEAARMALNKPAAVVAG